MADQYQGMQTDRDDPVPFAATITPSDATDLDYTTRALLLDAAGTVTVNMAGNGASGEDGNNIALPLQAGINPVAVTRVYATGTDGGLTIVALW